LVDLAIVVARLYKQTKRPVSAITNVCLCGGLTFKAKTIPTSKQPDIAATETVNTIDTTFERFLP
jgi:hypothetical protein